MNCGSCDNCEFMTRELDSDPTPGQYKDGVFWNCNNEPFKDIAFKEYNIIMSHPGDKWSKWLTTSMNPLYKMPLLIKDGKCLGWQLNLKDKFEMLLED